MLKIIYFLFIHVIFLSSYANECISSKDVFPYFKDAFKSRHMFFNLGVSCATSYLVLKALKKQSNKNKFLGTAISGVSGGTVFFGYSFCRFSNQLTKSLFDGKIEQGNYFFPTVDINEKKRIDFFSNKKYFSVFFNKINELLKRESYEYREKKI